MVSRSDAESLIRRVQELMQAELEVYIVRGDRGVSFTALDRAAILERVREYVLKELFAA